MSPSGGAGKGKGPKKRRDVKDVKRKRGGGKAPTGRSGTPRSAAKKKGTADQTAAAPAAPKKSKPKGRKAKAQAKALKKKRATTPKRRGEPKSNGGRRDDGGGGTGAAREVQDRVATSTRPGRGSDLGAPVSRVGVVRRGPRGDSAESVFAPGSRRPLDSGGRGTPRLRDGDLVLLPPLGRDRSGRSRVERVIGRIDNARDVLEALMLDRGLERGFPAQVEEEAESAAAAADHGDRVDLRALTTFTIDPASARDFDDAISALNSTFFKRRFCQPSSFS